jgi:hypothetical protein
LFPNTSTSLQIALAGEAGLAEGQLLFEETSLKTEASDTTSRNMKVLSSQKRKTQFRTNVKIGNVIYGVTERC